MAITSLQSRMYWLCRVLEGVREQILFKMLTLLYCQNYYR